MFLFAVATITPFCLILFAAFAGGLWGWLALGYITALVFVLDQLIARRMENADPEAEFPAADLLLQGLALLHFIALACSVWAIAGPGRLDTIERILVALATALALGQISHPVAHELIHRPSRGLQRLGLLIYGSILFGHHCSAHLRVHHVHVGSKADPNSARWGEGFWRFALRAWPGGYKEGLRAETRLRRESHANRLRHPYVIYAGLAALSVVLAAVIAGLAGIAALVFISLYAQVQILLSDYVQHYGLRRMMLADGRPEPVGPQHSWNAPYYCSSAMTLNAPRHSDHHVTPRRGYPALQIDQTEMPILPYSLPVMAVIALVPPLWRKIMDPRCAAWHPAPRKPADARAIAPAVLERVNSGSVTGANLPKSAHVEKDRSSVPQPQRDSDTSGMGRRADERG